MPGRSRGRLSHPSAKTLLGVETLGVDPGPYVWDTQSARHIPAVGRATQLYGGMVKQMPMESWRGADIVSPTPSVLKRPDPLNARSWFVQVSVEDYLLNGNTIALVTVRGVDGYPLAVMWLPAVWTTITWNPLLPGEVLYTYRGTILNTDDVIHVKRGADRYYPIRGIGVVEEYLTSLDRIAMEEEYERQSLTSGAVPSVAVIAPQGQISQETADEAKSRWITTMGGPTREPVILPNGSKVIPLAWSPTDAQLIEARKMSLIDVANMMNLDTYWLGSPVAGMTYKTASPQYQQILRTSIEPVIVDFEDVWGDALLPRGQQLRFDRGQLLREDLATTAQALSLLVQAGILTAEDANLYLNLSSASGLTKGQLETAGVNP